MIDRVMPKLYSANKRNALVNAIFNFLLGAAYRAPFKELFGAKRRKRQKRHAKREASPCSPAYLLSVRMQ
jgi:hypothetical protein